MEAIVIGSSLAGMLRQVQERAKSGKHISVVESFLPQIVQEVAEAERAKVVKWLRHAEPWHGVDAHTAGYIANKLASLAHHTEDKGHG